MSRKPIVYLSRSDRRVALFLVAIGVGALVALFLTRGGGSEEKTETDTLVTDLRPQRYRQPRQQQPIYYNVEGRQVETFPFDPNEADSTTLLRLGLSPWQVRSIYRYRSKGGIFRRPEDFARLYGLTQKDYDRLKPYIRISQAYQQAADALPKDTLRKAAPRQEKLAAGEHIDVNTADTAQLRRVPGIGSYFARQIVYRRQSLGGFHSLAQLREIKDFPESALPYLSLQEGRVQKVHVNSLSYSQLRRHPYIGHYLARAIVDYRRVRGPITNLSQLRMMPNVSDADLDRLRPYVEY